MEEIIHERRDFFRRQNPIMARQRTMLDTDTLTAVMRQHSTITSNAQAYLKEHHQFQFSIITQYEILRGLKAKGAN